VAQIVSNEFHGPTAAVADAASRKLYVVDANRLFEMELP
jgi:hypothetical protein